MNFENFQPIFIGWNFFT